MSDVSRSWIVAAAVSLAGISSVAGVTAQMMPLAFKEVAAEADTILLGRTVDSRSRWEENRDGKIIVTQVVFAVEKVYKGRSMTQTSIEFLGGTVGEMTFGVAGMPAFNRGDRDVLFLNTRERLVTPVVGAAAGRFKVVRDRRGVDSITSADGLAFSSVEQLGQEQAPRGAVSPMSLQEFEVQLAQTLAQGRR